MKGWINLYLLKDFKSLSPEKQLVSLSSCLWINCSPGQQLANHQDRRLPNRWQGEITFLPKKKPTTNSKKKPLQQQQQKNPSSPAKPSFNIGALEVHVLVSLAKLICWS